jgi:peptidyl-prolyl cis-trans isomerase SurA
MMNDLRESLAGTGRLLPLLTLSLASLVAACNSRPASPPVSANAWAVVDGHEITRDDVDKAYRQSGQLSDALPGEEVTAAELAILDDLIVQDLLVARARELKIEVPESELDAAYSNARQNIPEDAFEQELARRKLTAADMREAIRRDMLAQKLFEREVASKISVTDQDVTAFFEANRAQFNRTEDAYRVAQILITPVRDAQTANRTGDDATTPEEANAKLQMVMERLKGGAAFSEVAADFSEDPQTAPRGGDLGFLPVSAIEKLPAPLRDAVLKSTPGSVKVVSANGAHTVVLLVEKDPAGQKELSTPGVKEAITEALRSRREQVMRSAYISALRNNAVVVNLIAKRIIESSGKAPSVGPAKPNAK